MMQALTIENPVSFLLAFISMDTHSWPPNRIEWFSMNPEKFSTTINVTSDKVSLKQQFTYPSLLILLVRSSQRLFVSTKMMVLFSFSLMISSSKRRSLTEKKKRKLIMQQIHVN